MLNRRARWAVPGAAAVVAAGVIVALQIPAAQAAPDLPAKSAAALLASVGQDAKVPPLTGTVTESAALGLPQLPGSGGADSLTSLLSGSHTVQVSYQDATHFRLALPQPQAETDVIADGSKLWLWQSAQDAVTEFIPAAGQLGQAEKQAPAPTALTPQQAASQVLQAVGPTTAVSTQANVMVAGQAAYQLVLEPKSSSSLVGRVVIAVDAKYGIPLRVQLYARGATSPAFQTGYTALRFAAPGTAAFTFTPPPGATVDKVNLTQAKPRSGTKPAATGVGRYGTGWLSVAAFPQQDLAKAAGGQADAYSAGGNGVSVSTRELLNGLLSSGTQVHGSWGSGTLVKTSLMSMLITGGEVYVGAVQPSVLYAAVGHIS